MKHSTRLAARVLVTVLLMLPSTAGADLDFLPLLPVVSAPAGSSVVVEALIRNSGNQVVYLGSVSADLIEGFAGSDAFDDYNVSGPDSLLPGECWEGPVIRLTLAPDVTPADMKQVTLHFAGGLHRYDGQALGELSFALNDSTTLLSVPGLDPAEGTRFVSVSPNPARGASLIAFELAAEQAVDVRVYDVRGAAIRLLAHGRRSAGLQSVTWDGRDDAGARSAPGIYFVRLTVADGIRKTKVVRVH